MDSFNLEMRLPLTRLAQLRGRMSCILLVIYCTTWYELQCQKHDVYLTNIFWHSRWYQGTYLIKIVF